jgi:chromosome partitioning protein
MDTKVVAVINQKGGVGKTTIVAHLAWLAQADGFTTVVVDADQSASYAGFIEDRKNISKKSSSTLLIANDYEDPEKLRAAVERAREAGAEWIFIDTSAGICSLHSVAADLADIILIPTTPGRRDQKGTRDTVRLVRQTHKPAFFLISRGSQSKAVNDAAVTGLSSALGLPASSAHIVMRLPTQHAEMRG